MVGGGRQAGLNSTRRGTHGPKDRSQLPFKRRFSFDPLSGRVRGGVKAAIGLPSDSERCKNTASLSWRGVCCYLKLLPKRVGEGEA